MIRIIIIKRILLCNDIIYRVKFYNATSNFHCPTFSDPIHFFPYPEIPKNAKSLLRQYIRNENTPVKCQYRRSCITFHLRQFVNFHCLISTCRSMNALINFRGKKGAHKLSDKCRVHWVGPCCFCAIKKCFFVFPTI